jgi:hypothetical protein
MFDHLQGLIAGGGVDCGSTTGYVAPYALGSFCQVTTTSGIVNAGPQWFFVAPQFTSIINCPAKYSALLTCEPMGACCMPDESCQQATEDDCLNQFGGVSWLGAYTQCPGKAYQNVGAGGAFEDIRNTGTIAYNSTNYADTGDAGIPIGFAFTFYGNIFTTCTVAPKGYVTFDATPTADYTPDPIPSTNPPNNLVAALWQDLNPPGYPGSASVRYQMLGAPPNRHFVVQWTNVPRYWATGSNTFQLALYENGDIEYRYLAFDSPGNVSGIENSSGTEGLPVTAAQNSSLKISLVAVAGVSCNLPPVCKAGGPYAGECGQGIQLDGSSTFDPGGDPFTYLWTSDCPNATFDNPGAARPVLTSHGITQCPFTCTVTLTATDDEGAMSSCSAQVTMTDTVAPVASAELNPVSFICPRLANEYPGCKGAHAKVVVNCADTCGANSVGTATLNGVPVVDGEDIFVRVLFPWDTDKCPEVIFPDEGIECPVKQFCGHSFKLDSTCTDVCGNVGHGSDVFQCNYDEDEEGDWHDVPGNQIMRTR